MRDQAVPKKSNGCKQRDLVGRMRMSILHESLVYCASNWQTAVPHSVVIPTRRFRGNEPA